MILSTAISVLGAVDAVILIAAGVLLAGIFLSGKKSEDLENRVIPACAIFIGANLGAALILVVSHWFVSWLS